VVLDVLLEFVLVLFTGKKVEFDTLLALLLLL